MDVKIGLDEGEERANVIDRVVHDNVHNDNDEEV